MPRKANIGAPIRSVNLHRSTRRHETLGSLNASDGRSYYQEVVQSIRDGSSEQRCGGGVRIIRKKPSE